MASTSANAMANLYAKDNNKSRRVSLLKKTVAIAMWDFSWILRHHRYGSFGETGDSGAGEKLRTNGDCFQTTNGHE